MNLEQAYKYIFGLLDSYYDKTHSDELGGFLGGLDPGLFEDGKPADPAAWHDWIKAVRKITNSDLIDNKESVRAMILMLKDYNDNLGFHLTDVIEYFNQQISSMD